MYVDLEAKVRKSSVLHTADSPKCPFRCLDVEKQNIACKPIVVLGRRYEYSRQELCIIKLLSELKREVFLGACRTCQLFHLGKFIPIEFAKIILELPWATF